jgi:hypothetical protein
MLMTIFYQVTIFVYISNLVSVQAGGWYHVAQATSLVIQPAPQPALSQNLRRSQKTRDTKRGTLNPKQ